MLLRALFILIALYYLPASAHAAWFEASGQAMIQGGNKQQARLRATEDAVRQAMLFAGASVNSVQQIANGLLTQDYTEIRSGGELHQIELIDEQIQGRMLSVTIRADIFAQTSNCSAADYRKRIVTGWFALTRPQQATTGGLYQIGQSLAEQLARNASQSHYLQFAPLQSHALGNDYSVTALMQLANASHSQYVLTGDITDLSLSQGESSLAFWRSNQQRHLAISIRLVDGITGEIKLTRQFTTTAKWPSDLTRQIDVFSHGFWQSEYGKSSQQLIDHILHALDEALECEPAYAKVLQVANNQLSVSFGQQQGTQVGDRLTLFQRQSMIDSSGQVHYQYQLHPAQLEVIQSFANSATVAPTDGSLLGNIQAMDFVARR